MLSEQEYTRYQRQLLLKELGVQGQLKLKAGAVLVVGAGGLGCAALQYLVAAGVGRVGVVDFDVVDVSNLQRQVLYATGDEGQSKVEVAVKRLNALNPLVQLEAFDCRLETTNALSIITRYDLVLDCSDNFSVRYLVNDACVLLNKPLVYGAVLRFEGQVAVFNYGSDSDRVNYRDLFPVPPHPATVVSCNEAGVLGVIPGIIGTMQATEAIKIIAQAGEPLSGRLLSFNALNNRFYEVEIFKTAEANTLPASEKEFLHWDYEAFCTQPIATQEVLPHLLAAWRSEKHVCVVDVREHGELPEIADVDHLNIPLSQLKDKIATLDVSVPVVFVCQSGLRSAKAVAIAKEVLPLLQTYSLKGGWQAWQTFKTTQHG